MLIRVEGGGGNGINIKYYKINRDIPLTGFIGFIPLYSNLSGVSMYNSDEGIKDYHIISTGIVVAYGNDILAQIYTFSFIPIKSVSMDINGNRTEIIINNIYDIEVEGVTKEDIDNTFIEISEEEFYNFNPNNV